MAPNHELVDLRTSSSLGLHPCVIPGLGPGISVETGTASAEEWASILRNFRDANLYQTRPYGSVRWGEKRLAHVVLKCSGEIAAAAQVIFMKVPFLPAGLAYVKWGPLWQAHGSAAPLDMFHTILTALRRIYVNQGRMLLRISPWEFEDSERQAIIQGAGFKVNSAAERVRTAVLDLSYSTDDLKASLSRHWRYNLKLAEKNELEVREGFTDALIDDLYTLYEDMRRRKGKREIPRMEYLCQVQRELPEALRPCVMICYQAGVPVAGLVVSAIGSKAFAVAAATGTSGIELRGSYLLQWRMIRWLKDQNVRWYDLARINEKTHPGTTQFKLGLAGKFGIIVPYLGEFEAYESNASHLLVGGADRLRSIVSRVRSAIHRRAPIWKEAT